MFSPDRQGFFPALWLQLLDNLSPIEKEKWEAFNLDEDKIEFVAGLQFTQQRFQMISNIRSDNKQYKDLEKSVKHRELGNKAFQHGDLNGALVNYSRAVVTAPDGTEDLANAYANRANCLQKLGGFEYAIRDIKLAMENKYPQKNWFKLEERRAQCLLALKRYKEAKSAFESAQSSLQYCQLDQPKKNKFKQDVENGLAKIREWEQNKDSSPFFVNQSTADRYSKEILQIESPSRVYPSMSDLVTIQYQKGRGRFAVAKKDIEVGTTILNEKPIAWTLHPDRFGSHCTDCMKQIKSVVPCRFNYYLFLCSTASLYCSLFVRPLLTV